jgi:hypothetical protein
MDSEFDHDLRAALRREAYRPRFDLDPRRLRARLDADERQRRTRRRWQVVAGLAVAAIAVVVIATGPSIQSAPSVGQATASPCVESTATTYGGWWVEVGGPHAYFNVRPGSLSAVRNWWLIFVRFDPDAIQGEKVAMWAEGIPSGQRVTGDLNSRSDPKNIYNGALPAPNLPGGWYLFQQSLPTPGCWRLVAAIDGRVVGTAIVEVRSRASSREPSRSPLPPTPGIASPPPRAVGSSR